LYRKLNYDWNNNDALLKVLDEFLHDISELFRMDIGYSSSLDRLKRIRTEDIENVEINLQLGPGIYIFQSK